MAARSIKLEVIVDDKGTVKILEVARKVEKIGLASQKTKDELRGLNKEFKDLQYRASSLTKSFLKLASIGGIVGGLGFGKVASDVIRVSASFEKLENMLTTLTGSSEEAREALDWIVDFGSLTYGIDAVADAFVKLKSAGIDPTNGSLRALTEALMSYGKTAEDLKLAAIAIQQMMGKGVVSMEELRGQLAERIPDAIQIMASSLGLSQKEFEKLVSQGVIPAKEAIEALIRGLQNKYGGAIEKFADDFDKLVMRMKSQWELLLRDVGVSGPYGATKAFIKALTEEMKKLRESADWEKEAEKIGQNIMDISQSFALGVAGILDSAIPILKQLHEICRQMWEGYRSLPRWVQEIGLIGALTLGSKGRLLIAGSLVYLNWTREQTKRLEREVLLRTAYAELGLPKVKDVRGFKVREVWPSPAIMEQRLRGLLGTDFDAYMRRVAERYGFPWQGEGGSLAELKELQVKGGPVTSFVAEVFAKARENQEALKKGLQNIFSGGKKPGGSGKGETGEGETGEGETGLSFADSLKMQAYKDQAAQIKRELDLATLSRLERKLYLIDDQDSRLRVEGLRRQGGTSVFSLI